MASNRPTKATLSVPSAASRAPPQHSVAPTSSSSERPPTASAIKPPPRPPPIPPAATKNRWVTGSLIALVAVFFIFPFGYIQRHNSKADKKGHYSGTEPMGRTAVIRGAYVNTGSRDVGYDDEFYKRNAEVVRQLSEAQRVSAETTGETRR